MEQGADPFPERFGGYQVAALLGRGGMGGVWRATDTRRGRSVALKCLLPEFSARPEFRARFAREARVTASLSSPHVVPIHDWGEIDGQLYLDMRLVTGGTLAAAIAGTEGGLPVEQALDVLEQVSEALDAAHAAGLVHRDVKPSNVLLAAQTDRTFCYLSDFGIAKIVDDVAEESITASGYLVGTAPYTAPELYLGDGATAASDVYALGCVLYEMLSGRRAFPVATHTRAGHAHVHDDAPTPGSVRPELAVLDPVIVAALAKDPARRPASATALARAARQAWRREPAVTTPPSTPTAAPPPTPGSTPRSASPSGAPGVRRLPLPGRALAAVAAVAVLAAVALMVTTTGGGTAPDPVPPPAEAQARPVPALSPGGVAVSPDGQRAFLLEAVSAGRVIAVDPRSGQETDRYDVGKWPYGIAASDDGRTLAVSDRGFETLTEGGLSLVDLSTGVVNEVDLPGRPHALAMTRDGRTVYVADRGVEQAPHRELYAVDVGTRTVTRMPDVCVQPLLMTLSTDQRTLHVACPETDAVPGSRPELVSMTLDGSRSTTMTLPHTISDLVATPDGLLHAIATGQTPGLDVIDPRTRGIETRTPPGIRYPARMTATRDGRYLVVNQHDDRSSFDAVSVVDAATGTNLHTTPVAPKANDEPAVTLDGTRALVVGTKTLTELPLPS